MSRWSARYEEGFVNDLGEKVTVTSEAMPALEWTSEQQAAAHCSTWAESIGPGVRALPDGFEQTDDVAERPEFKALRIVRIWRRVTIASSQ